MKKVMMLLSILVLAGCHSLKQDKEDSTSVLESGKYALFDMQGNRHLHQIQLILEGKQWIANLSKNKGKSWTRFCGTADLCQLKDSTEKEIKEMFSAQPELLNKTKIHCIQNISAAFCRVQHNEDQTSMYRYIPLISDQPIMFEMRKLD